VLPLLEPTPAAFRCGRQAGRLLSPPRSHSLAVARLLAGPPSLAFLPESRARRTHAEACICIGGGLPSACGLQQHVAPLRITGLGPRLRWAAHDCIYPHHAFQKGTSVFGLPQQRHKLTTAPYSSRKTKPPLYKAAAAASASVLPECSCELRRRHSLPGGPRRRLVCSCRCSFARRFHKNCIFVPSVSLVNRICYLSVIIAACLHRVLGIAQGTRLRAAVRAGGGRLPPPIHPRGRLCTRIWLA